MLIRWASGEHPAMPATPGAGLPPPPGQMFAGEIARQMEAEMETRLAEQQAAQAATAELYQVRPLPLGHACLHRWTLKRAGSLTGTDRVLFEWHPPPADGRAPGR